MSEYTRNINAHNEQQKYWFRSINSYPIHILTGPSGVGKTYIATAEGCSRLDKRLIDKMVFLRPHVTTESIGFLPGDLQEKLDPFMRPLIDVAEERLSAKRYNKYVAEGAIEVTSALAFLRGRTFTRCWVIFDEAQNATVAQMKLVLTRLGEGTTLVIAGDPYQSDIQGENGLTWAMTKLEPCPVVNIVKFSTKDVVRSSTVKEILSYIGE